MRPEIAAAPGAAARGARFASRFASAAAFPVALIFAPPGFRASAVVSEELDASGIRHVRVDLEPAAGGPLALLRGLADAFAIDRPGMRASFGGLTERLVFDERAPRLLADWAARHLAGLEGTVVIDRLAGPDAIAGAAILEQLIPRTIPELRWIAISERSDILPVGRWLADNVMDIPLEPDDLRIRAADVPDGPLRDVCERAGGIPEAVMLAERVADPHVPPDSTPAEAYAVLARRFIEERTGEERDVLAITSQFTSFDDGVLLHAGISPRAFADVRAIAPLVRDASGVYRYDALFRAFVAETDAGAQASALRAARALQAAGRLRECLAAYARAGATDILSALIAVHGFDLVERGDADLVDAIIGRFEDAHLRASAELVAVKAAVESHRGNSDTAEAWYRIALDGLNDGDLRERAVIAFAIDLLRRERSDVAETLEAHCAAHAPGPRHALLLSVLAAAYAAAQPNRATETIDQALCVPGTVFEPALAAKVHHQAGYVALFARDFARAKRHASKAVAIAQDALMYDVAARSTSILYSIAIDQDDDIDAARGHLRLMAQCGALAGSTALQLYATLALYEIEVIGGHTAAIEVLDERLKALEIYYSPLTAETLLPAQALRSTWTGDFYRAFRLLAPSAENQFDDERRAHRFAEIAVYAAAAGMREEAAEAIDASFAEVRSSPPADVFVQRTKAFLVLALTLIGRHGRATKMLADIRGIAPASRMGTLLQAVRAIVQRWTLGHYDVPLADALARMERAELGGLARMLEALAIPESSVAQFGQLTPAERDILRHLAAGLSSKDIAALDGRSPQTVDVHIKAICRKLNCSGRRHAVARAIKEGLLPDALPDLG